MQNTLPEEIRSEFTVNPDGSTNTSIRGAARLAGVDHSVLSRHFSGGDFSSSKLAQKLIGQGFQTGDFSKAISEIALASILEYYAWEAGARCTDQARLIYKAFASVGIRTWLQNQLNYQPDVTEPSQAPSKTPTIDEINAVFAGFYQLNIQPELIESAKLSAIAKTFPHLSNAAEVGKQLLSSNMAVTECPLSPTKIGKIIAQQLGWEKPISARRINEALVQSGLQIAERVPNSKGQTKIQYKLTASGEKHGRLQMDTAQGHNKTVYVLRWFESVIPLIIAQFKE